MSEITGVHVSIHKKDKLLGFANVTLNHCFRINGIKIIQGKDRIFIGMPREFGKNEELVHPVNQKFSRQLETAVFERYFQVLSEAQ